MYLGGKSKASGAPREPVVSLSFSELNLRLPNCASAKERSSLVIMPADESRIAVIVPCYNEAVTIAKVVADFRKALPGASIYVYDNNSSDARPTSRATPVRL